jgi:hypothetical protein
MMYSVRRVFHRLGRRRLLYCDRLEADRCNQANQCNRATFQCCLIVVSTAGFAGSVDRLSCGGRPHCSRRGSRTLAAATHGCSITVGPVQHQGNVVADKVSIDFVRSTCSTCAVRAIQRNVHVLCTQASPCAWDGDADAKAQEHLLPHPLEHKGVLARTGTLSDDGKVYCKQCKKYVSLQVFEGKEVHSGVECCCSAGGALSGAQGDGAGEQQQLAAAPGNALPAGSYTILTEEGISLRVSATMSDWNHQPPNWLHFALALHQTGCVEKCHCTSTQLLDLPLP